MNWQAQLDLLLLRSKKENLIKQYCGEAFLKEVQSSFEDVLDFDILSGHHSLEVAARKSLPNVNGFDFLEQCVNKMRVKLHAALPQEQKSYFTEDGEIDWDEFFGDQFRNKPKAPVVTFPVQHAAVVGKPSEDQV